MTKRMIWMLTVAAAFIALVGTVKFKQVQTAIAQASSFQPPPEAVTTTVSRGEQWASSLEAIGTVVAVHGVTVSADLPGIDRLEARRPLLAAGHGRGDCLG